MNYVSSHNGQLQITTHTVFTCNNEKHFTTGLQALDALLPNGGFRFGAVHEVLSDPADGWSMFFAVILAQGALKARLNRLTSICHKEPSAQAMLVWSDRYRLLYPPALVSLGIDLNRLILLRPADRTQEITALGECLRCRGVCAVVGHPGAMSPIEARRLQLAAEQGQGAGIFLRHYPSETQHYAAATRWLVRPLPGERLIQRWEIRLLHGHGGRAGERVVLERCHATHDVRAFAPVADRQTAKAMA